MYIDNITAKNNAIIELVDVSQLTINSLSMVGCKSEGSGTNSGAIRTTGNISFIDASMTFINNTTMEMVAHCI